MICTYQDFAGEEEEIETSAPLCDQIDPEGTEQIVFPAKLHNMLDQVEKQGLGHAVGWAPHGRCFLVRNKNEFVSRILASWFRQSKFASFQRQLNLYGFKRITTGPDKGGYYHELFLRSKAFLCHRIERVKIKGSKPGRIKAYADAEPDFYRMKAMPAEEDEGNAEGDATASNAATTGVRAATSNIRPPPHPSPATEMNFALRDPHSRGISFLSAEPQLVTVTRNSPPLVEDAKDGGDNLKPHAMDPTNNSTRNTCTNTLNSLYQPSALSLSITSNTKQSQEQHASSSSGSNLGGTFSLLPNRNTSWLPSNTLPNLHPMLQASGRTNLVNLRDMSAGIFGTTSTLAAPATEPIFGAQMHSLMSSRPDASTLPAVVAPPVQQPLLFQTVQKQQMQQQPRTGSLPLDANSMPALNLPNELALSQTLPTAQSLALEDLFDNGEVGAIANVQNSQPQYLFFPPQQPQEQHQHNSLQQQQQQQQGAPAMTLLFQVAPTPQQPQVGYSSVDTPGNPSHGESSANSGDEQGDAGGSSLVETANESNAPSDVAGVLPTSSLGLPANPDGS